MTFSGKVYIELTFSGKDITCDTRVTMASQWLHNGCTIAAPSELEAKEIGSRKHA
jgi:hypothetical protein